MRSQEMEDRVRLVEQQILTVFIDPRPVSTLLMLPVSEVRDICDRARSGELELGDIGLDDEIIEGFLHGAASGDIEIETVKVAFRVISTLREEIAEAMSMPAPAFRP